MAVIAHSVHAPFRRAEMRGTVAPVAGLARLSGGADDSALAQRAAAGDGDAFAELYERHESRAFNLCYRILGSRDDAADATQEAFVGVLRRLPQLADRDLAFGSYVLTSARNACYDLIERRKRTQPSDEIPESATPMGGGVGGGGIGFDPGDPEDDPERNVLLEARTEEIRVANLALPERQREVLALRELEELSYDEIAELMDMNRNSVAQLISRARINLRDALRGTALASIAASSPDCERALPLIALEQDRQLDEDSNDAGWLEEHLMHCHTCRLGRDAMQEAGVSYRAWAPIAAGPLLFRETMAQAAEHVGGRLERDDRASRGETDRRGRCGGGRRRRGGRRRGQRPGGHPAPPPAGPDADRAADLRADARGAGRSGVGRRPGGVGGARGRRGAGRGGRGGAFRRVRRRGKEGEEGQARAARAGPGRRACARARRTGGGAGGRVGAGAHGDAGRAEAAAAAQPRAGRASPGADGPG